eukprot:16435507-Heterocapsa_arctica.AAC.1
MTHACEKNIDEDTYKGRGGTLCGLVELAASDSEGGEKEGNVLQAKCKHTQHGRVRTERAACNERIHQKTQTHATAWNESKQIKQTKNGIATP